jgi:outer membrane protein OmpA-like peptidoglycan-associated protein
VKKSIQQKVTFGSDELFDFDKATLKPGALVGLDDLVAKLKGATALNTVTVTGHTDGLGGVAYNQKLSVRRADAVRDYLVAHGVPADKIKTTGKGNPLPTTRPKRDAPRTVAWTWKSTATRSSSSRPKCCRAANRASGCARPAKAPHPRGFFCPRGARARAAGRSR